MKMKRTSHHIKKHKKVQRVVIFLCYNYFLPHRGDVGETKCPCQITCHSLRGNGSIQGLANDYRYNCIVYIL